jgi:hypothetical protein
MGKFLLVGGLEHEFCFPFHIWDNDYPIDELIFFQDGSNHQPVYLKFQMLQVSILIVVVLLPLISQFHRDTSPFVAGVSVSLLRIMPKHTTR